MKALWISVLILVQVSPVAGSPALDSLLAAGEEAYRAERYSEALDYWHRADESGEMSSADLAYNMGNAYWRMGELGESILYWNRALKLDPGLEDARYNLAHTEELIADDIRPLPESPVDAFFKRLYTALTPDTWGIIGLVAWLLMAGALVIVLFRGRRKSWILTAFCLFWVGTASVAAGHAHWKSLKTDIQAVVLQPNLYVKSAPMPGAGDAFILHEGTLMEVRTFQSDWLEIRLADGKVGWVLADEVGIF